MDPLSDVLSLLKPRSYKFGGFEIGGPWSIRFQPYSGIKCYAVVQGECWLAVDGEPETILAKAGDCFLLPRGRSFRTASDLSLPSIDSYSFFPTAQIGNISVFNGGGDFSLIGGHFALDGNDANILLSMLPPIVHLRRESDKSALRWSMERMRQELREQQPGGMLIAQNLAYMMLVQALRLHLEEGLRGGVGWLFALADKQISAAIQAIHADPAHRWTLHTLAEHSGMSRSSFAQRFKQTVGKSPLEYLTHWRMLLASDRLTHTADPISAIALSLGYESESAFSTAFKRTMGCSPRQYSRSKRTPPKAIAAD